MGKDRAGRKVGKHAPGSIYLTPGAWPLCWQRRSTRDRQPGRNASMGFRMGSKAAGGKWMALAAALLGWMFDGLEQGLLPLVGRPALRDLLAVSDEKEIGRWFAVATAPFLFGSATGGVLFGSIGDRIG